MDWDDLPVSKPSPVRTATSQIHIYTVQKWIWTGMIYQCLNLHPLGQQRVKSISTLYRNEYELGWFTSVLTFTRVGSNESNPYLHCTEMNMDWGDLPVSKPSPLRATTSQIHIYTVQKWIWTWVICQCLNLHPWGQQRVKSISTLYRKEYGLGWFISV